MNAGSGANDLAIVSGTANADDIKVNTPVAQRVSSAGENVDYTAALETLNVFGRDEAGPTGDTFTVAADASTFVNVFGGSPDLPDDPGRHAPARRPRHAGREGVGPGHPQRQPDVHRL